MQVYTMNRKGRLDYCIQLVYLYPDDWLGPRVFTAVMIDPSCAVDGSARDPLRGTGAHHGPFVFSSDLQR